MEETSGGADIAAWEFFGPGRVAELVMGNGLIMSHMNNDRTRSAIQSGQSMPTWGDVSSDRLGYDGAGRPITKRYLAGGINGTSHAYENVTSVVGFTTAYDRSSNKFYERHLHAESRSHLYQPYADGAPTGGYDSIDRLRQYQRGQLSSTGGFSNAGGGSIATPISLPGTDEFRTYDLDGLGNWKKTSFEPVGDSEQTELRQHNGLNQITRTDDGTDVENFSYDGVPGASNGNLANDGVRSYEWDALNRLIKVYKTPDTPVLIGEYVYDALNRRIRKTVSNGGLSGTIPNGVTDFVYNPSWQCVEERDDENDPTKQYVWGIYIDELLQQKTFNAINGNAAGNYYPLSDLLYRTTALTDSSGDIVEAYDCDAYGNTLIFTAAGTGSNWWADDASVGDNPTCEFIFTGRRYDSVSKIYLYRARYYNPSFGRFNERDPIAYLKEGNLYEYVSSQPLTLVDPAGEYERPPGIRDCNELYHKGVDYYNRLIDAEKHDREYMRRNLNLYYKEKTGKAKRFYDKAVAYEYSRLQGCAKMEKVLECLAQLCGPWDLPTEQAFNAIRAIVDQFCKNPPPLPQYVGPVPNPSPIFNPTPQPIPLPAPPQKPAPPPQPKSIPEDFDLRDYIPPIRIENIIILS